MCERTHQPVVFAPVCLNTCRSSVQADPSEAADNPVSGWGS